jgi:hypothetical protein
VNEQDIQQIKDVLSAFGEANFIVEDDYEFVQVELPANSISIFQHYLGDRGQTLYATKELTGLFDVGVYGVDTDTYMIETYLTLQPDEFTADNIRKTFDMYCRGLYDAFTTAELKANRKEA